MCDVFLKRWKKEKEKLQQKAGKEDRNR